MFLKTHTAYLQGGFWVIFPKEMSDRYLASNEFKFDVIANFPFDVLVFLAYFSAIDVDLATMLTIVRLPKLMRTARVTMYFRRQEMKLQAGFVIQSLKFVTYLVIITHTLSCIWFSIACPYGLGLCYEQSWIKLLAVADGGASVYDISSLYIASLYWTGIHCFFYCSYNDDNDRIRCRRLF
jgi:hypothetical protein